MASCGAGGFRFPDLAPAPEDVQFKEAGLALLSLLVDTLVDATADEAVLGPALNEVLRAPLAAASDIVTSHLVAPTSLFSEWSPQECVHEVG